MGTDMLDGQQSSVRIIGRRRLTALFLVLALGPVLMLGYLTDSFSSRSLTTQLLERVVGASRQSAAYLDAAIAQREETIDGLAKAPALGWALSHADSPGSAQQQLAELAATDPTALQVSLFDVQGTRVASTGSDGGFLRYATEWRDLLGSPARHQVTITQRPSGPQLSVVRLVDGAQPGFLAATFDLSSEAATLRTFGASERMSVAITDAGRNTILTSATTQGRLIAPQIDESIRARQVQTVTGDHDVMSAYAPLSATTAVAVVTMSGSAALAPLAELRLAIIAVTVALALLLFAGLRVLATALARRDRAEARMSLIAANFEHAALHDALTGLPNRALLSDRLEQALASSRRDGSPLAVLVLDLDGFKEINDTHGHHAGDRLLQEVAERLKTALREGDTVARLGGDEFAVLAPGCDHEDAALVAAKLRQSIHEPCTLGHHTVRVEPSIGIAVHPADADSSTGLLRHADSQMYAQKRRRQKRRRTTEARRTQPPRKEERQRDDQRQEPSEPQVAAVAGGTGRQRWMDTIRDELSGL